MEVKKLTLTGAQLPEVIRHMAAPPSILYALSKDLPDLLARPRLGIVGSRKITPYGKAVTDNLAIAAAQAGAVIVSGLAYGVDATAHRAALRACIPTIAILPSSLDAIYPAGHRNLAAKIIEQGGALITEYPRGSVTYPSHFIARNRLIAAFSDAVLITEAAQRSGALHTARFALEQGKDVLAVPGNITSPASVGANNLIKRGAIPVTDISDILFALGISPRPAGMPTGDTPHEEILIKLIGEGITDGDQLQQQCNLPIGAFNQTLTMLEIKGIVRSLGANQWAL